MGIPRFAEVVCFPREDWQPLQTTGVCGSSERSSYHLGLELRVNLAGNPSALDLCQGEGGSRSAPFSEKAHPESLRA